MKKHIALIIIFSFLFAAGSLAQTKINPVDSLKEKFEAFNYTEVISKADSLIKFNLNLSNSQLIEILRMKAISEFSLLNDLAAKNSFISILQMNKDYQLDSARTSPKIISFFNDVKAKYLAELNKQEQLNLAADSLYSFKLRQQRERVESKFRNSVIRSLVLPGLGQLYLGEKTKGLLLTSLSAVSLGSMIYFIIDSNNKERDYLNSSDPAAVQNNYDSYNNSYKLRNTSIITFAVLWLYSQIDLLLFSDFNSDQHSISQNLPHFKYDSLNGVQLGYTFRF